jgi:23S rRNA pseudouridine2457 synthase
MSTAHRYFVINKPCVMVSQFISADKVGLLGDLDFEFPEGTHAIGRLDSHSEGLLLLTTNKKVTRLLFQGKVPHKRTYLVMVRNIVSPETLEKLRNGVPILIKESAIYMTPPCDVDIIEKPATLHPDVYSYRERGPHSWLRMTLMEGKYHQVRKMVAAVGHQCKRLVRESIEDIMLGDIPYAGVCEMEEETFFKLLKIDDWRD